MVINYGTQNFKNESAYEMKYLLFFTSLRCLPSYVGLQIYFKKFSKQTAKHRTFLVMCKEQVGLCVAIYFIVSGYITQS